MWIWVGACTGAPSLVQGWKAWTGHLWRKIITENTNVGDIPESVISKKRGRKDLESESALTEDLEEKKHSEGSKNNIGQGLDRKLEITRSI